MTQGAIRLRRGDRAALSTRAGHQEWVLTPWTARLPCAPSPVRPQVFSFLSWGLLAIDGVLGLLVLRGRWREAMTLERENPR